MFSGLKLLLKKRLWHNCFPVNPFLYRTPLVPASQSWLVRNPEKRKWYLALQSSSRTKNFGRLKVVRFWSLNYTFDQAKQKTKTRLLFISQVFISNSNFIIIACLRVKLLFRSKNVCFLFVIFIIENLRTSTTLLAIRPNIFLVFLDLS